MEVKKGEESLAYILNSGLVSHFVFEQLDNNWFYYVCLS
jgi:carboxyl-terminal processing protease